MLLGFALAEICGGGAKRHVRTRPRKRKDRRQSRRRTCVTSPRAEWMDFSTFSTRTILRTAVRKHSTNWSIVIAAHHFIRFFTSWMRTCNRSTRVSSKNCRMLPLLSSEKNQSNRNSNPQMIQPHRQFGPVSFEISWHCHSLPPHSRWHRQQSPLPPGHL